MNPSPLHTRLLLPLQGLAGGVVVVGVSGGADSVALLRALVLAGAKPVVAHFDHALREESAADAEWVRGLAERLGLPFETVRVDVAAVAAKRGWNLEDAARRLRYDFLTRTAKKHGATRILTAHTRRDQAETVLVQLLRGEAVLNGMPAERDQIWRPWLDIGREDIEHFLTDLGQDWREDPTNADMSYTRAWLRQAVMPLLTARYPALETALTRLAHLTAEDDVALSEWAERIGAHTPLQRLPVAVIRRKVMRELAQHKLKFHVEHVEQLAQALQAGKQTTHLTLPENQSVTVTGGKLHLAQMSWPKPDFKYPAHWTLRHRQAGDRIQLSGGTRKVSDVLTEAHIPRAERDRLVLLADGEAVQWLGLNPPVWAKGVREMLGASPLSWPPSDWHEAMGAALQLAREAATAHEVPVGAVVLDAAGQIIGRGSNTSRAVGDMTQHAELAALREAAQTLGTPYLTDCTLVVTLEPCPMCLGASLEARVGRIVYGASNPKAGALGGVGDLLGHNWGHQPEIVAGVRAGEVRRLLKETFEQFRSENAHQPARL